MTTKRKVRARRAALLTHSLVEMVLEAEKKTIQAKELLDQARELDLHYIPSRYPNGIPSGYPHAFYSKKVAEQAVTSAEKIFSSVQDYFLSAGEKDILQDLN
jgi:HEPN domain-containing protein